MTSKTTHDAANSKQVDETENAETLDIKQTTLYQNLARTKSKWSDIRFSLFLQRPPDKDQLVRALESNEPIPPEVRQYLTGVIKNLNKLPERRGIRRSWWQHVLTNSRNDLIAKGIPLLQNHFAEQDHAQRHLTPIECAFEEMEAILQSQGHDIGVERIKKIYYKKEKRSPFSYW